MPEARRRQAATRPQTTDRESGFTLIELMVAMGIFTVLVAILLLSVSQLARGTVRVQVTAQSTTEVLLVFQNLDRQIRYADAINTPGSGASGDRYVEFRTPAASAPGRVTTCTQWRLHKDDGTIQSRRWTDGPAAVPSSWSTKLNNAVDVAGAGYPFELDRSSSRQKLVLSINTGIQGVAEGTAISTSFVARNSLSSVGAPVCALAGSRP
ncbi:PulJ/GspJ family protein [Marisediminicola antarctica]|uniref:Prepilin-type N-terminal cleavage/methylation domain-containing protein n=1 Tax=Marisediminicola antarctica TaxID=674079 RepID=A0A7L5AL24_9MICO|nr:type II secretion system protein [Marisediminicola antarctica]QHO69019.1 hypothetical protein BHD05_04545 [Marisediminicola antarctica]